MGTKKKDGEIESNLASDHTQSPAANAFQARLPKPNTVSRNPGQLRRVCGGDLWARVHGWEGQFGGIQTTAWPAVVVLMDRAPCISC